MLAAMLTRYGMMLIMLEEGSCRAQGSPREGYVVFCSHFHGQVDFAQGEG